MSIAEPYTQLRARSWMRHILGEFVVMWAGWDAPSRFLFGGALLAGVLLGIHIVARLVE